MLINMVHIDLLKFASYFLEDISKIFELEGIFSYGLDQHLESHQQPFIGYYMFDFIFKVSLVIQFSSIIMYYSNRLLFSV